MVCMARDPPAQSGAPRRHPVGAARRVGVGYACHLRAGWCSSPFAAWSSFLFNKDRYFRAALAATLNGDKTGALKRDQGAALSAALNSPSVHMKIRDLERARPFEPRQMPEHAANPKESSATTVTQEQAYSRLCCKEKSRIVNRGKHRQLIGYYLAKVGVVGSNPIARSNFSAKDSHSGFGRRTASPRAGDESKIDLATLQGLTRLRDPGRSRRGRRLRHRSRPPPYALLLAALRRLYPRCLCRLLALPLWPRCRRACRR